MPAAVPRQEHELDAVEILVEDGQQVDVRLELKHTNVIRGRVVDGTVKAFGGIDILINNAGITKDGLLMRMSEDDWDSIMAVHLKGGSRARILAAIPRFGVDATDGGGPKNTSPMAVYLQSVITLAPGVFIIPEVGYYDYDNNADGDDAGTLMYFGGKWQINF